MLNAADGKVSKDVVDGVMHIDGIADCFAWVFDAADSRPSEQSLHRIVATSHPDEHTSATFR
jgi:hypothetical protein